MATNIISNLSYKDTVIGVLLDQTDRKNRVKKYLDDLVARWPNIKAEVDKVWGNYKADYDNLTDTNSYDEWTEFFNHFHKERNIINLIIIEAQKEVDDLFAIKDTDSPIIKSLKETTQEQEHKDGLDLVLKDPDGGIAWYVFLVNTIKQTYLSDLPNYINEQLTSYDTPIALTDLTEQEWKEIRDKIYSNIYSGFTKVEEERNLGLFKTNLENQIFNLTDLIVKVKIKKVKEQGISGDKPADYDQIKADLKKWTDAFDKTNSDFNKEPSQIKDDYIRYKNNQEIHKPEDLKENYEEKELGIDNQQAESIAKKKLIAEIRRVAKLKNISVKFTNDKSKLIPTSKTDICLLLPQNDTTGNFNANLVLHDFAQEISKAQLEKTEKDLKFYQEFIKDRIWVKDNLSADYQNDYNQIINPSIFPNGKLDISQLLSIASPETLPAEYIKNDCVANSQIVDKTWQTIRDKALEIVSNASGEKEKLGIKIDIAYNNPDFTITLTYHPNSPITRDLDKLIITTPLLTEIERLQKLTGALPTNENFAKVSKQNELWEHYLEKLTDKENYKNVKEIIGKVN